MWARGRYVSLHRSEGFGLDDGRDDGDRQARDRHRLLRQHDFMKAHNSSLANQDGPPPLLAVSPIPPARCGPPPRSARLHARRRRSKDADFRATRWVRGTMAEDFSSESLAQAAGVRLDEIRELRSRTPVGASPSRKRRAPPGHAQQPHAGRRTNLGVFRRSLAPRGSRASVSTSSPHAVPISSRTSPTRGTPLAPPRRAQACSTVQPDQGLGAQSGLTASASITLSP